MTMAMMMGNFALIKDGQVINTVVWNGDEIDFGEGVTSVELPADAQVEAGYSYANGVFTAPPLKADQIAAQNAQKLADNLSQKTALMDVASERISVLQDAVDLDMATDAETAALPLWKKYRVLLSRVDANTSDDVVWPSVPVS